MTDDVASPTVWRRRSVAGFLGISSLLFALSSLAAPDDPPPAPNAATSPSTEHELSALRARLDEDERALAALRARLAAEEARAKAPSAPAPATQAPPLVSAALGKGLTVRAPDGRFELNVRGRIQARDTISLLGDELHNEINIKTARLILAGHLLRPDLRYRLQLAFGSRDFDPNNPSPIFDAHLDYVGLRDLNVRVGQFFVPFDRARTVREFALQLVERQQVVRELNLDRDVGVMLWSDDLFGAGGKLGYHLFLGGGEGRNRAGGAKPGALVVGRFVLRPFGPFDDDAEGDLSRSTKPRLALGVAGAYNHQSDRANSTHGAILALGTFDYLHAAADLVFKWRGFSLTAEGLVRRAFPSSISATVEGETQREHSRSGFGYFAQAGMMVSEHVEVAGRWEQLFAAQGTDPALEKLCKTQGNQVAGGLNVYLNGHALKLQGDYVAAFRDPASEPRHLVRMQLDATF
jgi:hypothetical protein